MSLFSSYKARAQAQANYNIETNTGKVTHLYTDKLGNVTAADVIMKGQTVPIKQIGNVSGQKVQKGLSVSVNFAKGNKHDRQLLGAAGSNSGASVAVGASPDATTTGTTSGAVDLSGYQFYTIAADETLTSASVLLPGTGVTFTTGTDPTSGMPATFITTSGGVNATSTLFGLVETDITESGGSKVVTLTTYTANKTNTDATTAEVVAARVRTTLGTTYPNLESRLNAMEASIGTGGGGSTTQILTTPSPYWRFQSKFNSLNRMPVATDFTGLESYTYYANGVDGSLRYETPGYTLDAYWQMGLKNTTGSAITVNWSMPAADNYASASWNNNGTTTTLFSASTSGTSYSGTFTIAAGTTGTMSLFYANSSSATYDTSNQGVFWFFMDALLINGVVFVDALTGLTPQIVSLTDATTSVPGIVEVTTNASAGSHPIVYVKADADAATSAAITASLSTAVIPSAETVAIPASIGVSSKSARADHVHAMPGAFSASGGSHSAGFVPDPGATAGTTRFLREDSTFAVALQKRRCIISMYQASSTADTTPNTTQVGRLPHGTLNSVSQWKLVYAVLRTESPSTNATTAQIFYVSNPANASFGSGSACLSSALTLTGATSYEASTTSFTGTLATTGLPSGSLLASEFTALGGSKVSIVTEWEEV